MDRCEIEKWDEIRWDAEFETLMDEARKHLLPDRKEQEVIVLKSMKDRVYIAVIPNFSDPDIREPIEAECIRSLVENDDTEIFCCLAMLGGGSVDIPSWHLRSSLLAIDPRNENTETILQGPGVFHVKQFRALMPPKK